LDDRCFTVLQEPRFIASRSSPVNCKTLGVTMRKRLRKKKRLGEFAEFGLLVAVTPTITFGSSEPDSLLDRFIEEAIERNDLSCGGGGGETWEFFVTAKARRASVTQARRQSLEAWLRSTPGVETYTLSSPVDAWHGNF
jgi:uncharacterized protein